MKKVFKKLSTAIFAAAIGCLIFVLACSEVGPIPEVAVLEEINVSIDEVDTAAISGEEVAINEGAVSNQKNEEFANTSASEAKDVAGAVESAVSQETKDTFANKSTEDIVNDIENGDTNFEQEIAKMEQAFASNPVLAEFIASITNPTGGRPAAAGRPANNSGPSSATFSNPAGRSQQDVPSCVQQALDEHAAAIAQLESDRDVELGKIDTKVTAEKETVNTSADDEIAAARQRHEDRKTDFTNHYNAIEDRITTLRNADAITADEETDLRTFNKMTFALNIKDSQDLLDDEIALIESGRTTNLGTVDTQADGLRDDVQQNFNDQKSEANRILNENRDCHNQGGGSGG